MSELPKIALYVLLANAALIVTTWLLVRLRRGRRVTNPEQARESDED